MMTDAELDRILGTWLQEGSEGAPANDVAAALATIARTRQRRGLRARLGWWTATTSRDRLVLVLAVTGLLVLAMGVAIGVGAVLLRTPAPIPDPDASIVLPVLTPLAIEDWPVSLSVPDGWTEVEKPCCDYREFVGAVPEGHLSVGHESPYWTAVCSPDCVDIEVPQTIPYDAGRQLSALKAAVADIAGSDAWEALAPGVLPQVEGGVRLETTADAVDGRSWRRVHVVGLRARNLVTIAWSQPADVFDPALANAILAGITLKDAPVYSDGDLLPWSGSAAFTMPIPGSWITAVQPMVDGVGVSGVRRFGDGEVLASVGDARGTLGWCDPDCREIEGLTSLDELEAAVRGGADVTLAPSEAATLDGEPARTFGTDDPVVRRYAVAMHDGRPVAIRIDVGRWDVAPGIPEEMLARFAFVDPAPGPADQVIPMAGGRVELGLPEAWDAPTDDGDPVRLGTAQVLTVRAGGTDGSIVTCDEPAAPWELCREITAATLAELAAAVQPAPIDDHGVPAPQGRTDRVELGGEPAMVVRIQGYEYPAQGGQEIAYVVAMHGGRPVIIRVRTTDEELVDLDSVIAGFRFVD